MKRFAAVLAGVLVLSVAMAGCTGSGPESGESGTITISGAFALYPMMVAWADEYQQIHPDVKIDVSAGGAGKGMTDALNDMVDIGMVSREIYPEEQERGAVWVSVAKDAVVGTMNAENPVLADMQETGLNKTTMEEIYITGDLTTWGGLVGRPEMTGEIHRYTRSDACGAATVWAKYFGYAQEDLQGTGVNADPGVAEAVKSDPLGLGYNNINFAYNRTSGAPLAGLAIVPLDLDGNGKIDEDERFYETRDAIVGAIADGRYPSPPARDLNLVTRDEFTGITRDFVVWILTDGQQYIDENGYVPLSDERLQSELDTIQ
ncbi:MAG: PstS family phosphate ABC transporter substrate-binding protein [Methanomicrobiales archaeon]